MIKQMNIYKLSDIWKVIVLFNIPFILYLINFYNLVVDLEHPNTYKRIE